jgi:2-dehydropantoate 2-reductase
MTDQAPRIGIIGAGAMGSSLAAITSRFAPTVMVCRNPERAAQIFEHGVRCTGALEAKAEPIIVRNAAELEDVGGVKYLFIAVKTTAIKQVCEELAPLRESIKQQGGGEVKLISYQNGIDPGRSIMQLLDTKHVMRMVLRYGAVIRDAIGTVEIIMHDPPHFIGCLDASLRSDCNFLAENFTKVGFGTNYTDSIEHAVWGKAIINAAINPVCALVNADIGSVFDSPARALVVRMLDEGLAVARAEGIDLGEGFRERAFELASMSTHHLPSMVDDIQQGRPSEVGQLNRQIVDRAKALGVSTPTHETIDALIETFDWQIYHQNG